MLRVKNTRNSSLSPLQMPAKKKAKETAAQVKTLEAQLWDAADKMRGAVPPTDYMHVCLGMVFLRYLSAAFERKENELMNTLYAVKDDPEEYQADNVFWVPLEARWGTLRSYARSADIGKRLDDAMRAIERYNDELKGVLPKIFGKADFSAQMLGGLIDHFTNLNLSGTPDDFDLLGRVYEFFLGEFSAMQGKAGGEQYTPRCMVSLMVEMIEPFRGRIYDPCCGTGGFYVQSNRFVLAHAGRLDDVAVFGQERNPETYRLARMNLAIRGITGDIRWNSDGTLLKDAFPDMRFDSVLANPPFNIKEWGGEFLRDDARWKFGVPPLGNANFAWLQHMYHHLTPNGYAAVILANGSMSSNSGGEGEIRKARSARRWSRAMLSTAWSRCPTNFSSALRSPSTSGSWRRTRAAVNMASGSCAIVAARSCSSMPASWATWSTAPKRTSHPRTSPSSQRPTTHGARARATRMFPVSANPPA
jgi:type I restriction enzyme M protein